MTTLAYGIDIATGLPAEFDARPNVIVAGHRGTGVPMTLFSLASTAAQRGWAVTALTPDESHHQLLLSHPGITVVPIDLDATDAEQSINSAVNGECPGAEDRPHLLILDQTGHLFRSRDSHERLNRLLRLMEDADTAVVTTASPALRLPPHIRSRSAVRILMGRAGAEDEERIFSDAQVRRLPRPPLYDVANEAQRDARLGRGLQWDASPESAPGGAMRGYGVLWDGEAFRECMTPPPSAQWVLPSPEAFA